MAKLAGTDLETLELSPAPPADDDPCWCRSQEKFGLCHKNRESQVPDSKWAILRKMRQLHSAAYCSHPAASPEQCHGQIVRAHTLQRAGCLSAISVDQHVYGLEPGGLPADDGKFHFKRIGINRASTFSGFCQRHDSELFRPIETEPFRASKEQLFLLGYRALAKEVYAKRFALRMQPILRRGDVGRDAVQQVALQKYLYLWEQQIQLSLRDLQSDVSDYSSIFLAGDFDRMSAYLMFADRTIDFAVCGGFYPEYDFDGCSLQNLATTGRLDFMSFSALPLAGGSVIAFVWDSTRPWACMRFLRSLDRMNDEEVPDALVRLVFEHFENNYLSPSWWEALSDGQRGQLEDRFALAASPENRKADCLFDDGLRTTQWKIVAREWR